MPISDPEDTRRRRLLNILLVGVFISGLIGVIYTISLFFVAREAFFRPGVPLILATAFILLLGSGLIYGINRRSGRWAALLFLILLTISIAFSDTPAQVEGGRSLFFFALPIIISSLVLYPAASFIFAALSAALIGWLANSISLPPNIPAMIGFIMIALVSWLSSRGLEQALHGLQKSELKLRSLFAAITDSIMVLDRDGRFLEIAPTNPVNLYRPSEDLLGKTVTELFPPAQATFFLDRIHQTLETGKVGTAEYSSQIEEADVWYSASISPLSPNSVIWVAHNITSRRSAEEQIRRQLDYLTALGEIDRIISSNFDLRPILASILSHVLSKLGVDAADLLLFNSISQVMEYSAGVGFYTKEIERSRLRLGEGLPGQAALNREIVHVGDLTSQNGSILRKDLVSTERFISYWAVPLFAKGQIKGVLEIFHRTSLEPDREWLDFLKALAEQAAIAVDNANLFESLQRSNTELRLAYDATIEGWSHALDLRDEETEGHTRRVTEITVRLARLFDLSAEELVGVRWGALLHDIGKMGVPDGILLKAEPLTEDEWVAMRKHPTFAHDLLSPIRYLRSALDIPYCHHEKWDGSGYPRGLKGDEIPLTARIFAVVDVWDALRSDRPYRAAWPQDRVREHIRSLSGSHFDPEVVRVCLESGMLGGQADQLAAHGSNSNRSHPAD